MASQTIQAPWPKWSELRATNSKHLLPACWLGIAMQHCGKSQLRALKGEHYLHPTPWHHFLVTKSGICPPRLTRVSLDISYDPGHNPRSCPFFKVKTSDWPLLSTLLCSKPMETSPGVPKSHLLFINMLWHNTLHLAGSHTDVCYYPISTQKFAQGIHMNSYPRLFGAEDNFWYLWHKQAI